MIDGNKLMFGYGDISVNSDPVNARMGFRQFKPPAKVGDSVNGSAAEWVGERLYVDFTASDIPKFDRLLFDVKHGHVVFEFGGLIFDFTNYNEESVNVCERFFASAITLYQICLAC